MIKKYPFIKQMGLKDCAAASVLMILKYYKGFISMPKLEEMLKTTRNGTTAYHIIETLKQLGFTASGIKLKKLKETKTPFIAHTIINRSYKHYIVVYEVTKKHVVYADPASKIKKIKKEDFYKIWTGINIEMHPNKLITNEKPKTNLNILKMINKVLILKIGLLSIVVTILSIITSFFFMILIDNMNKNIKIQIIIFLILMLLKIIIDYWRHKTLMNLTNSIDYNLTTKIFNKIIHLPYIYYHNHTTGEIISRINDLNIFKEIIGKIIIICFIDMPLTILSATLLYYINKTLFKIALLILVFYIFIIIVFHKKINNNIDKTLYNKADLSSFMTESISGYETIKGINIQNKIINIFNNKYKIYIKDLTKLNNILNKQNFLKNLINTFGQALILIIGISLVQNQIMTLSIFITYNILTSFFLEPVKNIIDLDFEIKKAFTSVNRVLDLISYKKEKTNKQVSGDITIKNLKFTMDDINYILKGISLKIKNQSKVLITGKSGSGKSTLLKILKGYYKGYEGEILIDNKPRNIKNVVYISNKETLFTGTINYNFSLNGSKNLKGIKQICYTDEIIKDNVLGYNMLLEENGFNISNGQKQRLILARALSNFDVLLIDEALNGIDKNLERKILKNILKKYKNKTIIIVSHRLDNLDLFDHFIKLENGKVILDAKKNEERSDKCLLIG